MSFHVPNHARMLKGQFGSDASFGNNGAFFLTNRLAATHERGTPLKIIASDGAGWEHVSVSLPHRCPTWAEMAFVKSVFWDGSDCVVQFHPPESEYVNNHPYCLHLWRSTEHAFPLPPSLLVGYKDLTPDDFKGLTDERAVRLMEAASDAVEGSA
jgi:hypothetical protein